MALPEGDVSGGLSARVASGLAWLGGSFGGIKLVALLQTIVVARLLTPSDFGVYAMAALATALVSVFTGLGMRDAIVQSPHEADATLNSAFCLGLARAALLYGILFVGAPWIEAFYATPGVAAIVRTIGLTVPLGALSNPGPVLFYKELDYRRTAIYGHLPELFGMAAAVGLAFWMRSAWALVFSQLATTAVGIPLSYWAHPFRPRLRLDSAATRHLLRYGSYILGSTPLFYLSTRIDELVVGRWYGSHSLGAYQLAYNSSALPATYISEMVMSVLFPVLAQLQAAPGQLRDLYMKSLRHLASLSLPASALLFLFADELVGIVYGAKWAGVVPLLRAFSLYGALRSVMSVSLVIFKATGQTQTVLKLAALNLGVVSWVVAIGAPYGPVWIAVLLSLMSVPAAVYGFELTGRILGLETARVVRACLPAASATLFAFALTAAVMFVQAAEWGPLVRLVFGGSIFVIAYAPALLVLDPGWVGEVRSLMLARSRS